MTAYLRTLVLVLFGVLVFGFVVYVWQLDPDPAPRVPPFPSTTPVPVVSSSP